MDEQKFTFEYIEQYLAGELPASEKEAMEKEMAGDAELTALVAQQRRTHLAVDLYTRERTRERIEEIYSRRSQEKDHRSGRRFLAIAAAISTLVIVVAAVYFILGRQPSGPVLATAYLEPFPDRITTMGDSPQEDLAEAMRAYNDGDFQEALRRFEALSDSLAGSDLIRLYRGVCHLEMGQSPAAMAILQGLDRPGAAYQEPARWYLALAHLQNGTIAAAEELLEQIAGSGGYRAADARQLLKKVAR